jgi:hypothetical protein
MDEAVIVNLPQAPGTSDNIGAGAKKLAGAAGFP